MGKAIFDWSTTAASNASADTSINWAEGQSAASVNNSARALMARVAAFVQGLGATLTVGGSSNAYTMTSASGHAVTSYAAGMLVAMKATFTNTGAATLNYDGVGAIAIKKGGTTSLDAGDFVSGAIYLLVHDGTYWQAVGMLGSGAFQPLDSTLTAFAAQTTGANLIWYWTGTDAGATTTLSAFGRTLIDDADAATARATLGLGTAATVATGTSGNTLGFLDGANTWSGANTFTSTSASTAAATVKNTTDNASVAIADFTGARATPTAGDNIYINFNLNNASSAKKTFANILIYGTTLTAASEAGRVDLQLMSAGTLTGLLSFVPGAIRPVTNDGVALGAATLSFSDLFLASGAVFNFNNGNVVLTHSTGALTMTTGDFVLASTAPTSTASAGYRGAGPVNVKTTNYTTAASDEGHALDANSASAIAITIKASTHTANAELWGVNMNTGTLTLTRDTGVTFRDATGANANQTVNQYQQWYARRDPSTDNLWYVRVS